MNSDYIMDHPFHLVLIGVTIFMYFMYKDVYKWNKHQKHVKEIEEKKKKRALKQ